MKLMNSGNLLSNRTRISALLLAVMLLLLTGCSSNRPAEAGTLTESGSAEETTLPATNEPLSEKAASEPRNTEVQSTGVSDTEVRGTETRSSEAPGTEAETEGGNDRMFYWNRRRNG